jgi:hypothetical protein
MAHGELDATASLGAHCLRAGDPVRTSLRTLGFAALPFVPDPAGVAESVIPQRTLKRARGAGPGDGFELRIRLPHPTAVVGYALERWQNRVALRKERPWLAFVAVPLALTAALDTAGGLDGPIQLAALCGPLSVAAWWWSPRDGFLWTWLLPIEAGAVTVCWSMTGASALAFWPADRPVVGLFWAGAAAVLGVVSFLDHRRAQP